MWAVASREWRRDDQGNWHGVTRYLAACRPNRCLVNHQPCPTCGGFTRVDHTTVTDIAAAGSGALEGLGWRAKVDRHMRAGLVCTRPRTRDRILENAMGRPKDDVCSFRDGVPPPTAASITGRPGSYHLRLGSGCFSRICRIFGVLLLGYPLSSHRVAGICKL